MKRLPTKAEFDALLKLTYEWDEKRNGLLITSDNGNWLFFPALGCKYNAGVYNVYYSGYYWSATQSSEDEAMYLHFYYNGNNMNDIRRLNGHSVRLISDEPCNGYIDMGTGIYWAIENYHEGEKMYFNWEEAMEIPKKINGGKVECSYPNYNLLNLNQNSIACTHVPEEHLLTIPKSMPIDWEQRRYEIAKAALAGLLANPLFNGTTGIAKRAVKYADDMIKQLKQNNNETNNVRR